MTFAAAFVAAFTFVFLKSWQQQNVVFRKYLWIMPTSMAMAFCEGYVVYQLATAFKVVLIVTIGLGSGLGCMLATYLHNKLLHAADRPESA
jgi:uncharacterized membrane protein YfcA